MTHNSRTTAHATSNSHDAQHVKECECVGTAVDPTDWQGRPSCTGRLDCTNRPFNRLHKDNIECVRSRHAGTSLQPNVHVVARFLLKREDE